jgi:feruloyl esterase
LVARAAEAQKEFGQPQEPIASRLTERHGFGSNPGNLRMWSHVPDVHATGAALVVVLHGCKQDAAGYDSGTGWSTLADRYGFAVLFPEQQTANNPNACFNWFLPGDTERGRGEALSIRQMIETMATEDRIDRSRIFVTGLSAGGAMTSVMLATYPEVFAGGAIIAGLPYRCATTVHEALDCMFQGQTRDAREWGGLVRSASRHEGPWPRISVWHGTADTTVKPMNADEIVKQWLDVHGMSPSAFEDSTVDGYPCRSWRTGDDRTAIESYSITGMAHGTPLAGGEGAIGRPGPFLLDVGIASSVRIAESWGLVQPSSSTELTVWTGASTANGRDEPPRRQAQAAKSSPLDIGATISGALRAAGLMK